MKTKQHSTLLTNLTRGKVYRRDELATYSRAVDRDLKALTSKGSLKKVGPGLYYYPKKTRFGLLPPNEQELVSKFLKTKELLLLSPNWYNTLGLGLTQLSTTTKVYNRKRYETLTLAGYRYCFVRPNNGFPKKLSREFLLVDLINNLDDVGEDKDKLRKSVTQQANHFNKKLLFKLAEKHGKVGTRKFFKGLLNVDFHSSAA